jgi:hypothetical protein
LDEISDGRGNSQDGDLLLDHGLDDVFHRHVGAEVMGSPAVYFKKTAQYAEAVASRIYEATKLPPNTKACKLMHATTSAPTTQAVHFPPLFN